MNKSPQRVVVRSFPGVVGVCALALAAAGLAGSRTVSYTGSDPRGTLLTAQAVIEHGTLALDGYPDVGADYRIMKRRGRTFYAYPPGTPLLAVPAVAIARLAGLDMARAEDDDRLQRVLSAISIGAVAALATLLASRWLPWTFAVSLAAIFVFGTPVISTMATALWSTNATVVATMAALLLLSHFDVSTSRPRTAAAIGLLLGVAFWCRPPAFLVAGLVIAALLRGVTKTAGRDRPPAIRNSSILISAIFVFSPGLLVLMSRVMYGTWLPDYYTGMRVAPSDRFWTALTAHLVSPSRGLLIFAPVAALAVAGAVWWPRRVFRFPLAALGAAWLGLHLLLVSRFPYWWGGYCYGSRLMVDALPAVFLLLCGVAAVVRDGPRPWQAIGLAALVAAGAGGIWINSVQGLFNPATAAWNVSPDIDRFPGYALDWRLPQFLATPARLDARLRRHDRWVRASLEPDVEYAASSTSLDFDGWALPDAQDAGSRRSTGSRPSVRFLVTDNVFQGGGSTMMLTLAAGAEHGATGDLWLNGRPLAALTLSGPGPDLCLIAVPRSRIRTLEYDIGDSNVLEWRGSSGDDSILLRALRIHVLRQRAS